MQLTLEDTLIVDLKITTDQECFLSSYQLWHINFGVKISIGVSTLSHYGLRTMD